jgi:hypothetical protein
MGVSIGWVCAQSDPCTTIISGSTVHSHLLHSASSPERPTKYSILHNDILYPQTVHNIMQVALMVLGTQQF